MRGPVDELDIFKPVSGSILKDENSWPIIPLNNADVTSEETGELEDLLLADDRNLVTVTGRIDSLDQAEKCHRTYSNGRIERDVGNGANISAVIDRDSIPCNITVPHVQRYSFGQYDDGTATFWVRGQAGWFELTPSRRYRQHHKDMSEAIKILYFISDLFHEMPTRKQMRSTRPQTLFERYAEDAEYNCADAREARNRFVEHRDALCILMRQGKEGIAWKQTSIFKFLQDPPPEVSANLIYRHLFTSYSSLLGITRAGS